MSSDAEAPRTLDDTAPARCTSRTRELPKRKSKGPLLSQDCDIDHRLSPAVFHCAHGDGLILKKCEASSPPALSPSETDRQRRGNTIGLDAHFYKGERRMTKTAFGFLLTGALLLSGGLPVSAQDDSQKAAEVFAALDANKDGRLSQTEFDRLFAMQGEANVSAQDKQNEFKAWDADGDQSISGAEFTAKYAPASRQAEPQR